MPVFNMLMADLRHQDAQHLPVRAAAGAYRVRTGAVSQAEGTSAHGDVNQMDGIARLHIDAVVTRLQAHL